MLLSSVVEVLKLPDLWLLVEAKAEAEVDKAGGKVGAKPGVKPGVKPEAKARKPRQTNAVCVLTNTGNNGTRWL